MTSLKTLKFEVGYILVVGKTRIIYSIAINYRDNYSNLGS